MKNENIAADIPPDLAVADELLTKYGRWATTGSRSGRIPHTVERGYIREADRKESLEAWMRRCEAAPKDPVMPLRSALNVQRALALVPQLERTVLAILYIPKHRLSPMEQLRVMQIPPRLSRERHAAGLRMFWHIHKRDAR